MGSFGWGGGVNSTSMYTDDLPFIYNGSLIGMPSTRVAANGNNPIRVDGIGIAYGENCQPQINYQSFQTGGGTVFGTSGGSFRFDAWRTGGRLRVGRNTAAGGLTYWSDGDSLSGQMPGSLSWSEVPSAPQSLSLSTDGTPGRVGVSFVAPVDNGGQAVNKYRIRYWRQDTPGTVYTSDVAGSTYITGLTPGVWEFDVAACNIVSDGAGTTGPRTSVQSILATVTGKVRGTSAFVQAYPKVWNGTVWKDATIWVWDGIQWDPATGA